jgi:hypothetical protein
MTKSVVPSLSVTFRVKSPAIGASTISLMKKTPPSAVTLPEVRVKLSGSRATVVD